MIRLAREDDILDIAVLLREYSYTIDIEHAKEGFSLRRTSMLVSLAIRQGLVWVYKDCGNIEGCLVAQEQFNIFSDTIKEIHLLAIYVSEEYRDKTVGGRLLIKFDKECDKRKIPMTWIGKQVKSELKDKSLAKLGYRLAEQNYIKEK